MGAVGGSGAGLVVRILAFGLRDYGFKSNLHLKPLISSVSRETATYS